MEPQIKGQQVYTHQRSKGNGVHYLPLSYIDIPVFGSMRKGNLQKNLCLKF